MKKEGIFANVFCAFLRLYLFAPIFVLLCTLFALTTYASGQGEDGDTEYLENIAQTATSASGVSPTSTNLGVGVTSSNGGISTSTAAQSQANEHVESGGETNGAGVSAIVITEIAAYEPSGHEWIEIYNRSDESVDVSGWVFWEAGVNHAIQLAQGENYMVQPRSFAIIAVNAGNFLLDYPQVSSTIFDSAWSTLNESGEEIGIKDMLGNVVEIFTYIPAPDASLERINYDLDEYSAQNWKERESGNSAGSSNDAYLVTQQSQNDLNSGGMSPSSTLSVTSTTPTVATSTTTASTSTALSSTSTATTSTQSDDSISTDTSSTAESASTTSSHSAQEAVNLPHYSYGDVVVNEFVSSPESGEVEFIEIKNTLQQSVDLDSWYIKDGSGAKTYLSGMLESDELYVVEKPKGSLNNSGDEIHIFDSHGTNVFSLAYGAEGISVPTKGESMARHHSGEYVITTFITKGEENEFSVLSNKSTPAGGNSSAVDSKEKNTSAQNTKSGGSAASNNSSSNANSGVEKETQNGLEHASTGFAADSEISARISVVKRYVYISEIMPNPAGSDETEFIELYNASSSSIEISGFVIDDMDGGSRGHVIPSSTAIAPFSFMVFPRSQTGVALNNTDDEVRLLAPSDSSSKNEVIYSVPYVGALENASYAYVSGTWQWTEFATPGSENIASGKGTDEGRVVGMQGGANPEFDEARSQGMDDKAVESAFYPIADAYQLELGSAIAVRGVVTVLPGVFGTQYFYIHQMPETGIQVYMFKKDFPALEIGDVVEVSGEITESKGERRIKISKRDDIQIIGNGKHVEARDAAIYDLAEIGPGALVRITGEITSLKRNTLYIDDGTDEMLVYVKTGTNIDTKKYKEGDTVAASGLLVPNKTGLQLLPRLDADIQKIEHATSSDMIPQVASSSEDIEEVHFESASKQHVSKEIYTVLLLVGAAGAWYGYKMYKKR